MSIASVQGKGDGRTTPDAFIDIRQAEQTIVLFLSRSTPLHDMMALLHDCYGSFLNTQRMVQEYVLNPISIAKKPLRIGLRNNQ
jgi:hypothetical protein